MSDDGNQNDETVTLIGLGPMGRAIAGALLGGGARLTVWNRTRSRADDLVGRGARRAGTPAEAVAASAVTLVNVVDHDALDAVLDAAGDAVAGRDVIGLSSDTPARARRTAERVAARGGHYLDGAIMTPVETVGTSSASILVAGPAEVHERRRGRLETLGRVTWVGTETGRAATFDMALLDLFWTSIAGYLHALALARAEGIEPGDLLTPALGIAGILPPVMESITRDVAAGDHAHPTSSLASIRSSLGHLVAASRTRGLDVAALEAFARLVGEAVDAGYGEEAVGRVVELSVPASG